MKRTTYVEKEQDEQIENLYQQSEWLDNEDQSKKSDMEDTLEIIDRKNCLRR